MKEKELRRLSRLELMQLLLEQTRETNRLARENERLRNTLSEREIRLSELGNIADAALALNRVFEAAQKAADQYVENAKRIYGEPKSPSPGQPERTHPDVSVLLDTIAKEEAHGRRRKK